MVSTSKPGGLTVQLAPEQGESVVVGVLEPRKGRSQVGVKGQVVDGGIGEMEGVFIAWLFG
jgi:hypothetical protein